MDQIDLQVSELQSQYPDTTTQRLPSGSVLIIVPSVKLTPGWSKETTAVFFLVPVGFPHAQPDCFWVDADLRLQNGSMPKNAGPNVIPESGNTMLWFSWHLAQPWNPNRDTLTTWFAVIRARLREAN